MPRYKLNERFQSHIRKAQRTRRIAASVLGICLIIGIGFAFAVSPSTSTPRASLKSNLSQAAAKASAVFAPISNISRQQQVAATSESGVGNFLFRIVCTIFRNCPEERTPVAEQRPQKANSYPATSSEIVKSPSPAPAEGGAKEDGEKFATKNRVIALQTQANSIETDIRDMKRQKLVTRVADLEENVFGAARD